MKWDQIEGWFSVIDAQFVRKICTDVHNGIVVELGFYAGRCTAAMAPICRTNNNVYYAIDNCKGGDIRDPATKAQRSRDMRKIFEVNMKRMKLLDYLNIHIVDSATAAQMFNNESVNFCFIDASHVFEDVQRDIEAWWPKIKVGGTLSGHDYLWTSVREVINAFVKKHGLNLVVSGNCWKFAK